ncbi:hypothetical protein ADS79_28110 [Brevibacillus reuszeri]|uniref:Uncharacterized protein n=1 Tax=Brevibacillus reuszeri TaxID=54915 RepID=A0A0K9YNH4_9BACL|nr:hypothetical protein ADS79_28110 [Brevibacillus reuszeri]
MLLPSGSSFHCRPQLRAPHPLPGTKAKRKTYDTTSRIMRFLYVHLYEQRLLSAERIERVGKAKVNDEKAREVNRSLVFFCG